MTRTHLASPAFYYTWSPDARIITLLRSRGIITITMDTFIVEDLEAQAVAMVRLSSLPTDVT